jgi:glycosyltransferase 2 family protein
LSLLISLFILPIALKSIVRLLQYDITLKRISVIIFYSQFAKYLPGGIWGYVGRVYLYKKEGMNTLDATKSVLLETFMVLLSGIFVSLASLPYFNSYDLPDLINNKYLLPAGIFIFIILSIFLHPKVLNVFIKIIPDKFKKPDLDFNYNYFSILKPLLYLVIFWLGIGISFWLLIKSFINIEPSLLPMLTGMFVISWIIGILVFFMPGGFGIREISIVLLLSICLPPYFSAFIAVISRIWWIAGETICFFISYLWDQTGEHNKTIHLH